MNFGWNFLAAERKKMEIFLTVFRSGDDSFDGERKEKEKIPLLKNGKLGSHPLTRKLLPRYPHTCNWALRS
jgi:hypothetical protein